MKSRLCFLLAAFALSCVAVANAGQAPDPELTNARQALDDALSCVQEPFVSLDCRSLPGGSVVVTFRKFSGDSIVVQALQNGSAPREWRVSAATPACAFADNGLFQSTGQGFHPWKRDLRDLCSSCVDDPQCLNLQP